MELGWEKSCYHSTATGCGDVWVDGNLLKKEKKKQSAFFLRLNDSSMENGLSVQKALGDNIVQEERILFSYFKSKLTSSRWLVFSRRSL